MAPMEIEVIPDKAVVAATKVLYADKMSDHSGDNAPQIIDACETVVKKILEAAAPYMMAQAWKEGEAAGQDNAYAYQDGIAVKSNPYKKEEQ